MDARCGAQKGLINIYCHFVHPGVPESDPKCTSPCRKWQYEVRVTSFCTHNDPCMRDTGDFVHRFRARL